MNTLMDMQGQYSAVDGPRDGIDRGYRPKDDETGGMDTPTDGAYDLLYFGEDAALKSATADALQKEYGEALTLTDADDDETKGLRFHVEVAGITMDDLWKFLIRLGVAGCGLSFGLAVRMDPERIRRLLDELEKAE